VGERLPSGDWQVDHRLRGGAQQSPPEMLGRPTERQAQRRLHTAGRRRRQVSRGHFQSAHQTDDGDLQGVRWPRQGVRPARRSDAGGDRLPDRLHGVDAARGRQLQHRGDHRPREPDRVRRSRRRVRDVVHRSAAGAGADALPGCAASAWRRRRPAPVRRPSCSRPTVRRRSRYR
jgi:hypothetical protein